MKDIAAELDLSQTTVSHVLRGRDAEFRIGADTARRVREAARRLNYRPSAIARSLKAHRAYSIALAAGDLANPFWAGLAVAAQQEAERHGYMLIVYHTAEALEKEHQLVEMLRQRRVDGLILSPAHLKPRHLAALREEGRPFVLVDRAIGGLAVPSVVTDSIAGLQLAVDHLAGKGHTHIGYLGGPTHIPTFRDRLVGFRRAMAKHRLAPGSCVTAASDPEAAHNAALRLLKRRPAATAVIAANFWLTVGLLRAAPDDVVVVGFDDIYLADLLRRPVTTVVQPLEKLGQQSVRLLLEEIDKPGRRRNIVLAPRLIVR